MTEYIEQSGKFEKYMFWFLGVPVMVLLFLVLSQPAWRGDAMLAEMRANCDKVGGVMIETKQPLVGGSTFKCAERLDR